MVVVNEKIENRSPEVRKLEDRHQGLHALRRQLAQGQPHNLRQIMGKLGVICEQRIGGVNDLQDVAALGIDEVIRDAPQQVRVVSAPCWSAKNAAHTSGDSRAMRAWSRCRGAQTASKSSESCWDSTRRDLR